MLERTPETSDLDCNRKRFVRARWIKKHTPPPSCSESGENQVSSKSRCCDPPTMSSPQSSDSMRSERRGRARPACSCSDIRLDDIDCELNWELDIDKFCKKKPSRRSHRHHHNLDHGLGLDMCEDEMECCGGIGSRMRMDMAECSMRRSCDGRRSHRHRHNLDHGLGLDMYEDEMECCGGIGSRMCMDMAECSMRRSCDGRCGHRRHHDLLDLGTIRDLLDSDRDDDESRMDLDVFECGLRKPRNCGPRCRRHRGPLDLNVYTEEPDSDRDDEIRMEIKMDDCLSRKPRNHDLRHRHCCRYHDRLLDPDVFSEELDSDGDDEMGIDLEMDDCLMRRPCDRGRRHRAGRNISGMYEKELDFGKNIEIKMEKMRKRIEMSACIMRMPQSIIHSPLKMPKPIPCKRILCKKAKETAEARREKMEKNEGFLKATEEGDLVKVKDYISRGAALFCSTPVGWTSLHIAASKGYVDVVNYLLSEGMYRDCRTHKSETPMMLAIHSNHSELVEFLLQKQASVALKDSRGYTPLLYAAETGSRTILKMLVDNNADVNMADKDGNTALILAAKHNHVEAVKFLVSVDGVDLEKKSHDNQWTALHWAVFSESSSSIRALVREGAAMNAGCRNEGETPVMLASRLGRRRITQLMYCLEAQSHRRVMYCSDGQELKYLVYVVGPPLFEVPAAAKMPVEVDHILPFLRAHEGGNIPGIAPEPQNGEERQGPLIDDLDREIAAAMELENIILAEAQLENHQNQQNLEREQSKEEAPEGTVLDDRVKKLRQQTRREIKKRRKALKLKLDPTMAERADELRVSIQNLGYMEEIYPPPMQVKIDVYSMAFLVMEEANIIIHDVCCVSLLGMGGQAMSKPVSRRG